MEIKKTLLPDNRLKPLFDDVLSLKFGQNFTDYMFTLSYNGQKGWHDAEIKPYQPLSLDPAASVFHYGQEVFEGQKAYKSPDGDILLFRPLENAARINQSLERMSMPQIPVEFFLQVEEELLRLEQRWVPSIRGASLYLRPTVIATEPALGVKPSSEYLFFIILSPVGAYYQSGFNPVSLWVSRTYSRAAQGGTGAAKAGGNYGGSLKASGEAARRGYQQVLWLDSNEHTKVEEVGAMNIFFIMDGKLTTPALKGTILPGITRKSIIQMAPDLGIEAEERDIDIRDVVDGIRRGSVTEIFGAGTAAVISPVGKIGYEGEDYIVNGNETGPWAQRFFDSLTGIQYGLAEDPYGWVHRVKS